MANAAVENAFASIETIEHTVNRALEWARDCHGAYLSAKPTVRRQMNQAFFDAILITEDGVSGYDLAEPFASLIALGEYLRDAPKRLCCVEASTDPGKQQTLVLADEGLKEVPLVEVMGFEPTASSMRPKRSSQLSYTPGGPHTLAAALGGGHIRAGGGRRVSR